MVVFPNYVAFGGAIPGVVYGLLPNNRLISDGKNDPMRFP